MFVWFLYSFIRTVLDKFITIRELWKMYNNTDRKHIPMENRKEGPAIGNNISLGSFLLFFFFFYTLLIDITSRLKWRNKKIRRFFLFLYTGQNTIYTYILNVATFRVTLRSEFMCTLKAIFGAFLYFCSFSFHRWRSGVSSSLEILFGRSTVAGFSLVSLFLTLLYELSLDRATILYG